MSDTMGDALREKYLKWKDSHDEGYVYDEIFNFVDGLSRGDMCEIMDYYARKGEPSEHKDCM